MSNNTGDSNKTGSVFSTGESHTSFGKSVESQAQFDDAQTTAGPSQDTVLNVYRLIPVAAEDDPRWQNTSGREEIVVAARTTGDARIVASSQELDFMEIDAAPAEGTTTNEASQFRSEKLYTVVRIESGRTDLERGVLQGNISINNLVSTQKP
jgi:hypothetical protein